MKPLVTVLFTAVILPACMTAQTVKVACMGNSITVGGNIRNETERYPAQLQRMLGEGYEVKNFGQNSQTVQMNGYDLTEGSQPGDCAYRDKETYRRALEYKPDIVVLKLGTNDSKYINWLKDSPENFRHDLNCMLDELRNNSNPRILICYPVRVKREDWTINETNIHSIIAILRQVAAERSLEVVNLHTAFEKELGNNWDTIYSDGVHPDSRGAAIIARKVADVIINRIYDNPDIYTHE